MRRLGLAFCFVSLAGIASANIVSYPSTEPLASAGATPLAVPGCPDQGGILDSVSVPVGDPLDLRVVIGGVAPEGGARFRLSSDNPAVAAVGDRRQGFLPEVTIPEGESISNPFTVFGISVGGTLLRATSLTPGFFGFAVPLGAWDVGSEGASRFLDPNRPGSHCRVSDDSPELSTDESVLADCGVDARGAASDGVSRLLMRAQAGLPGTACFEVVSSATQDQGSIDTALKSTASVGSLHQASSYYRAPASFESTANSRTVEIEFTYTPSIGNGNTTRIRAEATLVRPPRVLVHGIWSNAAAWRNFWIHNSPVRTTVVADYEGTNDDSFSRNVPTVLTALADAVEESREKGYATTQVDVIGHSMGGLLTRLGAQHEDFVRPDNLGEGDVRRLLTLATPHFGSSFANLVVALHDAEPEQTRETIGDVVPGGAEVTNGAVCDLAENSPALNELAGGTALPARVVTATGGPAGTPQEPANYWGGRFGFSNFEGALTETECLQRNILFVCVERRHLFPQDIVDGHRFREGNDAIVPVSSARAGFSAAAGNVANYPDLLHFGAPFVAGVTNRNVVANQALPLIDAALPSNNWAVAFPAVQSDGSGSPLTVPGIPGGNDAVVYAGQCAAGGPMKPAGGPAPLRSKSISNDDPRVQIIAPVEGQEVAPGSTLVIEVAIEAPLQAIDLKIRMPGIGRVEGDGYDGSSYFAEVEIPEEFAGPMSLIPAITDTAGNRIHGPAVNIAVRAPEAPQEIYVVQHTHRLDLALAQQSQLRVIGVYAGDIERDVTSAAAGTSYASSDTGVVTVDAGGRLTPNGLGTAVITVQHGDLVDFATVIVREGRQSLPPADVSTELHVGASGFRLDRNSGFFVQQLRITNRGQLPVPGPLYAVVGGLPAGVELITKAGVTPTLSPIGSPYLSMELATDGLTLHPGESVDILLRFLNPDRVGIQYGLGLFRTSAQP
ncbi:MAG TPA: alpha/beta fold hydrolase [Xanthomonadaceae bacterium]|nr:alpha/beta fold hydrolase [Xanthomonadaceae bacterium]